MAPLISTKEVTVQEHLGMDSLDQSENNNQEILYDGWLYNVTEFSKIHPGGKIIHFYTKPGEDATIAIQQFHHRSFDKVKKMLNCLPKRPAKNKNPDPDELTKDYQNLFKELLHEGYFRPSYGHVVLRFLELFAILSITILIQSSSLLFGSKLIAAGLLGILGGRAGWIMHEGGHHSLTGIPTIDRFLQAFAMGFFAGNSASWWRSQHNRHHAMPQRMKHDVDLDTLPLLAFNSKVFKQGDKSVSNFFLRHQSILFLTVDGLLVFLLWKWYLCPRYAWKKKAYSDLFFMFIHSLIFVPYLGITYYLVATWVGGNYMLLNFALSHTHLPVTEEPKHWVEYCLSHTADIQPSWWCDWLMGYLNYQVEHHLFPTMPQFRQRLIKDRVEALAKKHGLPYVTLSYTEALQKTFKNLRRVETELHI